MLYVQVLSPHSPEQQDLLHRLNGEETNPPIEHLKQTLKLFTTKEIIAYPFPHQTQLLAAAAAAEGGPDLLAHWKVQMHSRVVQHNVRVAAGYYERIRGSRLASLLGLTPSDLEKHVSTMVSDGDIYAKIDRPADVIRFSKPKSPDEILGDWSSDIHTLLNLVEDTTHAINKEMMV